MAKRLIVASYLYNYIAIASKNFNYYNYLFSKYHFYIVVMYLVMNSLRIYLSLLLLSTALLTGKRETIAVLGRQLRTYFIPSVIETMFCIAVTEQQQCSVTNLPVFQDSRHLNSSLARPSDDKLQAIVPAFSFTCTGRVTEWKACVEQGGGVQRYYIQFQVWRSTGLQGCYRLVGSNAPPLGAGGAVDIDLLLQPSDHCLVLPVAENEQIEFQPGDVIGYYADRYRRIGNDPNDGGVQWIENNTVVVYHTVDVPLSDLKTEYAISPLGPDPAACGFNIAASTSNSHVLSISTSGAPIITLTLGMIIIMILSSL